MTEQNIRLCKVCRIMKNRVLVGKFDAVNKKWADEKGKLWNGSVCPDCHRVHTKSLMSKKRKGE